MSNAENELKRVLDERAITSGKFPDFFPFKNVGDELIGKYIGTRQYDQRDIYTLEDLKGQLWSVGATTVIKQFFVNSVPVQGDYILIRLDGEGKSKRGRPVKLFTCSKIPKEDAEKILHIAPSSEKQVEQPTGEQKLPSSLSQERIKECTDFFTTLFNFYEKMSKEDLEKRIKQRFPDLSFGEILTLCPFIEYDAKTDVVKKIK